MEIFKYRWRRTRAAAFGCRCRVKIPFLFPTTRVISVNRQHNWMGLVLPLPGWAECSVSKQRKQGRTIRMTQIHLPKARF